MVTFISREQKWVNFEKILILRKNCHFWEKNCQFQKLKISQEKWSSFRKIANFQKKLPIFCKITTVSTQNTNCNGNILSMDHHGTKRHTVLDQLYAPPPCFVAYFYFVFKIAWLWNKSIYERLHNQQVFFKVFLVTKHNLGFS